MKDCMKAWTITAAGLAWIACALPAADTTVTLADQKQKLSYTIGHNLGNSWKNGEIDLDLDVVQKGIKDAMSGAKPLLSPQEMQTVVSTFQKEYTAKRDEIRKNQGEKNLKEGEAFLEENKKKPGVQTTASGLQYKVITEGQGPKPKTNDMVKVHYRGTLIDGTEFDSSYSRGQPAVFGVNRVISGWTEGLQLMPVGSKYQLFIPSQLAYRETGAGQKIGPNAVLQFEVELIEIQPPKVAPAQPVTSDIIKVPSAEELKKGAKIEVIKKEDVEKLQKEAQEKQAQEKK